MPYWLATWHQWWTSHIVIKVFHILLPCQVSTWNIHFIWFITAACHDDVLSEIFELAPIALLTRHLPEVGTVPWASHGGGDQAVPPTPSNDWAPQMVVVMVWKKKLKRVSFNFDLGSLKLWIWKPSKFKPSNLFKFAVWFLVNPEVRPFLCP